MKAVHFGAGKIGRGFIADLLHNTGYEITFVDVNEKLNAEMNQYHNYYLYVIQEDYRRKEIDKVSDYAAGRSDTGDYRRRSGDNSSHRRQFSKDRKQPGSWIKSQIRRRKRKGQCNPM